MEVDQHVAACLECSAIPCEKHAQAISVALFDLQQFRLKHAIPVSQKEQDFARALERRNQCHRRRSVDSNQDMDTDENALQEPTMVERTIVDFRECRASSKRCVSVSPAEARGRCMGCHVPIESWMAYCGPCYRQSPDGRAKRARIATEMCVG